ncbi:MAG: lamin tail domain-containing protein [Bacteroidota bacterium]
MKTNFCFLVISLLCWQGFVSAQVVDDFSDGDLSNNPAWNGETALFQVNSAFELQSNGNPANDTIYLSTPNTRLNDTEWRFRIRYNFGPSTTNNLRVYLVSDQSDLEGDLQGYFLRVGESGTSDSYDLYRQDGSNLVQMIDGIDGRAGSNIDALVKISRDGMGNWSLATDTDNSGVFTLEGNVFDDTYASTAHTGFWVKHSSTRNQSFFFDDFYIGDPILDLSPPVLQSVVPQSATELLLTFDENLDLSSSEDVNHYSINQGIGNPLLAERDGNNETEVLLTLAAPLQNGQSYQLSVLDVMDQNGNGIDPAQQFDFSFLIPEQAIFKDIIFHEIMPDPSPVVNLPEVEYIELHNRSDKIIDLAAWTLSNGSSVASLPSYILTPGDYVVLLKNADINAFTFNNKIVTSSSVALVNGGDNLGLRDANGTLIDTLDYLQIWHEPAKADGGYSLEIIDPDELDCPPRSNWSSSVDTRGGSPGIFNSLAPIPDTEAPVIQTFQVLSPTLIRICFNEAMDPVGLVDESQYTIDQGIGIPSNAVVLEPDRLCVDLSLSGSLQQGTIYTLTVGSVQDCKGNELGGDKSLMIVRGRPPLANDIVITEFMADPTPRLGLPEAEFIELYNRSDDVIDLNGYQLSDGNAEASLDNALLFPGEYGIVCSINDSAAFVPFGKIFPVFGLPGLGCRSM